jgi:uncharacterized alpha-E superfamily protein
VLLSSLAKNLYWFGRYIERVENTARVVMVNDSRLLDIPPQWNLGWEPLIQITSGTKAFYEHYDDANEHNVVYFLLMDIEHNPGAMLNSINLARENLRPTRALFPNPIWEVTNELHSYLKEHYDMALTHHQRYKFLRKVIDYCHLLAGKLAVTSNHDEIYEFLCIGCNLERADMTSRIVDIKAESLLKSDLGGSLPFEEIQWKSVLDSLAAWQMYRRRIHVQVSGVEVLRFLLQDKQFPRSINYSLAQLEQSLYALAVENSPRKALLETKRKLIDTRVDKLVDSQFHHFIDELQIGFNAIHQELSQRYFE